MYVTVLGPVRAHSGEESIAVSSNQRLLIAMLAARAGRVVSADLLIDTLWGAELPNNPAAALQNLVSRIRARLCPEDGHLLMTDPPGYRLILDETSLDRIAFERTMAVAAAEPDDAEAISIYDTALELWNGAPYVEFDDVPALREDRVRLQELCEHAREQRLERLVRLDPATAVGELESRVDASPYRERGHALLMDALDRTGRPRDALRAYARYRDIMVDELGLDPSPAMQRLEHEILVGGRSATPPVAAKRKPPRRHNLTSRRTSFVGRIAVIDTITRQLRHQRLVTLVGVGGAGKTSLATETARSLRDDFDDGAWIVDLLALADGSQLSEYIAGTIGLPVLAPGQPIESLVDRLHGRSMLVVLDNCEHLIADAANVADAVLDGTNDVRLLATSREPLRVPGETVVYVEPLDVPESTDGLREILATASGRLFVDRVAALDPRFQLEERDSTLLTTICRRLDGLPLALELAAARVPALGMQQLADRLDDRFSLLTSNHRHAVEHHQTLRAAIGWSVDLLNDAERVLLARLSVFVGGFDLDAAESVAQGTDLPAHAVADALAALVDRSLVVSSHANGTVRHRLLETIREYAATVLDNDTRDVSRRHRDWYLTVARAVGDGFLVNTTFWYQRLRTEFPNLRASFVWSMEHGQVEEALDLAGSLRWAPFNTGHLYREHRAWIEAALAAARDVDTDRRILGRGLVAAGAVAGLETRSTDAIALLSEALDILTKLDAWDEIVWCHMWLGAFHTDLGDYEAGVEHTRAGLTLARSRTSPTELVYLANQHAENAAAATLLHDHGHFDEAHQAYVLAIAHASQHGIEEGLVRAQHGLAVLRARDDAQKSFESCVATVEEWRRLGHGNRLIMSLVSAARIAVLADKPLAGVDMQHEALDVMGTVGWNQPLGRLLETAAVMAAMSGNTTDAGFLAGAASNRFLTPRWFVPIPVGEHFLDARTIDPEGWDLAAAAGAASSDAEAIDVVRRQSAGSPAPTPRSRRSRTRS